MDNICGSFKSGKYRIIIKLCLSGFCYLNKYSAGVNLFNSDQRFRMDMINVGMCMVYKNLHGVI
jgi:hypothetical protein